jgi:hypothetical protein
MQGYNNIGADPATYVYSQPIDVKTYYQPCYIVQITDPPQFPFK